MLSLFKKIKNLLNSKLRAVIAVIIIIVAIYYVYSAFFTTKQSSQYQTSKVTKSLLISTLSESGSVSTTSQATINSPTDGIIQDVYVKDGDKVNEGDKLVSIRSTATVQEQQQAYASYLSAQNNLNSAKAKINSLQSALFKANQAFVNDKGISNPTTDDMNNPVYIEEKANWLQAESDYNNQQGVINQAQISLNSALLAYQATQDSVVTAPISGIVANISVTVGSNVAASSNTTSTSSTSSSTSTSGSSALLKIGDFSNPIVSVQASEVDIPQIKAGQSATITLSAFSGKTFVGRVENVDTVGTTSSGVVTYNVYLTFVSPPADIRPGMSATAIITTARKNDALSVPTTAIQTSSGQSYVKVLKNGQISQASVETGISSDTDTEITSGLSEGDTVVTSVTTAKSSTGTQSSSPFSGLNSRNFGGGR
jgi:membrane fusion protein, macrolide-specific efflux system